MADGNIEVGDIYTDGKRKYIVTRVPQPSAVKVDVRLIDLVYFEHGTSDTVFWNAPKVYAMHFKGNIQTL